MDRKQFADYEPVVALAEIGRPALPYLLPLLSDRREAGLDGSEEATESEECHYRRADWACCFASLILRRKYTFSEDPMERDKGIAPVKKQLEDEAKARAVPHKAGKK